MPALGSSTAPGCGSRLGVDPNRRQLEKRKASDTRIDLHSLKHFRGSRELEIEHFDRGAQEVNRMGAGLPWAGRVRVF